MAPTPSERAEPEPDDLTRCLMGVRETQSRAERQAERRAAREQEDWDSSLAWVDDLCQPDFFIVRVAHIGEVHLNPGGYMPMTNTLVEEPEARRGVELEFWHDAWPLGSRWCVSTQPEQGPPVRVD